MESTLKNMVLTLLIITLVASATLGGVYSLTKEPIEASKAAKTSDALSKVLPEYDNEPAQDTVTMALDGMPIKVYTARKGGIPVGYAVETLTKQGFSGEIKMMVGFLANGDIFNIDVLEHNETPGLGSKMADEGNVLLVSFAGKNPADLKMAVKKDGGDIDVITASTISSRAYTDAVQRAYEAYKVVALGADAPAAILPYTIVLPEYANDPGSDPRVVEISTGEAVKVETGTLNGNVTGYAITASSEGYNGPVVLCVGFLPDGTINDIAVVTQQETPGYGAEIAVEDNVLLKSFKGHKPSQMKMSLKPAGDIDGFTGATVTSDAYVAAIQGALEAFNKISREDSNE